MSMPTDGHFHLVLAHGISDGSSSREEARTFWSTTFPQAVVTDAEFLTTDTGWGTWSLTKRAGVLLNKIEQDRKPESVAGIGPTRSFPLIFLCHELGSFLAKQALILASRDKTYSHLTCETALMVFVDALDSKECTASWEHQVIRLLAAADLGSYSPTELLKDLPNALEDVSWSFMAIERQYTVFNIESKETDVGQGVWNPAPGNKTVYTITDTIERAVREYLRVISQEFWVFMDTLSRINRLDHQLRFHKPFGSLLDGVTQDPSYNSWKAQDPESPNLLYMYGCQGSSSAVVASELFFELRASFPVEATLASFSSSELSSESHFATALYTSLTRQLLLADPLLFRRVASVGEAIRAKQVAGFQILHSLLLTVIRASTTPVVCIIHSARNSGSFPMSQLINMARECRRLGDGLFKMVVIGGEKRNQLFFQDPRTCCVVDATGGELGSNTFFEAYAKARAEKITRHYPQWQLSGDAVLQTLRACPRDLDFMALAAGLLESKKLPSTQFAALEALKSIPNTFDALYTEALGRFQSEFGLPLGLLLKWITGAVRPLALGELAVVAAFDSVDQFSLEQLKLYMPMDITQDLRMAGGILIELSGMQILPKSCPPNHILEQSEERSDWIILSHCLDYLEMLFDCQNSLDQTVGLDFSEEHQKPEYGLLGYAVVEWPRHYRRAQADSKLTRVLNFFQKQKNIESWFTLYRTYTGYSTDRCSELNTVLKLASWFGFVDLAQHAILQVQRRKDGHEELTEPLNLAAAAGQVGAVTLLLQAGAHSRDAMCLAAEAGSLFVVQALDKARPMMIHEVDSHGRTPFILAAMSGNDKISTYLLEKGADVCVGDTRTTPLHLASETGQMAIISPLIDAGVNIHARTSSGNNALQLAAAGGFDGIVELLLRHGARVDEANSMGMTALHLATMHGHASTIQLLLDSGSNASAKTEQGFTIIHLAAEAGFTEILRTLIPRVIQPPTTMLRDVKTEETGDQVIHQKDHHGDEKPRVNGDYLNMNHNRVFEEDEASPRLFDERAAVLSPLQLAALNGHTEIVSELLQHSQYSSDETRATSLLLAAREGHLDIVDEVLKSGIATSFCDTDGNTALHLASQRRHPDIVGRLLSATSGGLKLFSVMEKNKSGLTPLHWAASSGSLVTVRMIHQHGARLESMDNSGRTALHLAASSGHHHVLGELLMLLTQQGSDAVSKLFTQTNGADQTPLILAIRGGHLRAVQTILETFSSAPQGLELPRKDNGALKEAVQAQREDLVRLLLESGWEVNAMDETTALHSAAANGQVRLIKLLLDRGADPNALDSNSEAPLHKAVLWGPEPVRALLQEETTMINKTNGTEETPLWKATWYGKVESVKELLQASPDLEVVAERGDFVALHAAYDNPDITRLLLVAGADPSARTNLDETAVVLAADEENGDQVIQQYIELGVQMDYDAPTSAGFTALHIAANAGRLHTVQLLEAQGASIHTSTGEGVTALHLAAYQGHSDVVGYLLEQGLDVNYSCESVETPLIWAARGGDVGVVELLLDKGADINATDENYEHCSALQTAAWEGRESVVRILLDHQARPNLYGGVAGSPLCAAVRSGKPEIVKLMLDHGAEINYDRGPKGTALEYAVKRRTGDVVDLCLEWQAEVNIVSKGKHGTPLVAAIHNDNIDHVRTLLHHGANPNLSRQNNESVTPVEAAIRLGGESIFKLLIENGAKLSFRDRNGRGPLSSSIVNKSFDLLPHLLEHRDVHIDEQDGVGRTPLMLAALQGASVTEELCQHGANLDLQDTWGRTALTYAVTRDYPYIVSSLLERGAELSVADVRGRDALYWASRRPRHVAFEEVLQQSRQKLSNDAFQVSSQMALNAAVAMDNSTCREKLLCHVDLSNTQVDSDGWTNVETAVVYKNRRAESAIKDATPRTNRASASEVKIPAAWHPSDLSPALLIQSDPGSLAVSNTYAAVKLHNRKAVARADHAMWPQQDGVYYFEVSIEHEGDSSSRFVVGFCEEHTSLGIQLGWEERSWGYHGDDGRAFTDGRSVVYGPRYGKGDVVGCGVNFDKEIAFYTLNGEIIGKAFNQVRGKLYPAISADVRMAECRFSARFWERAPEGNRAFRFKGPFNHIKTMEPSLREREHRASTASKEEDSISDATSSSFDSDC